VQLPEILLGIRAGGQVNEIQKRLLGRSHKSELLRGNLNLRISEEKLPCQMIKLECSQRILDDGEFPPLSLLEERF